VNSTGHFTRVWRLPPASPCSLNVTYFENGKTKLREVVSLNGTIKSEEMNEEGKLVSEKASRNQVPVGTWKYYWPDGKTVKIKEEYENGDYSIFAGF
jgi:antitoxin component YwqK of YwqJK toxin-antitoxin module